jgi:hypothetical protein
MLCIALRLIVLALRIRPPIEREAVARYPLSKVTAINRAYRNRAPIGE